MKNERIARRTGLVAGVSAGLLGGAAIGLTLGVPGITSAAAETPAVEATVAALAQTDVDTPETETETETDTTETDTPDTDRITNVTDRTRELLDVLVQDGTISAEQADAVAAHLADQIGERDRRFNRSGRLGSDRISELGVELSDFLGIDRATLFAELRDGASLAEVAEANGVSTDELVAELVAAATERLGDAVENGRIDQAAADELLAGLDEKITERVTTPRGER